MNVNQPRKQGAMENPNSIRRSVSLRPEQMEKLGKVINLKRYGQFSQFVQDSVDEKLNRLFTEKPELEAKAS